MGLYVGFCFPADGMVVTPQGMKKMSELRLGDKVRVVNANGSVQWSDVCAWAHREPTKVAKYLNLTTANSGRQIKISEDHLLAVVQDGKVEYLPAGEVKPGHTVLACDMTPNPASGRVQVWSEQVQRVDQVEMMGVYAPVTTAGTIAVDGLAASCYASTRSHRMAHAALKPMRTAYKHNPEHAANHHHGDARIGGSHSYIDRLARVAAH